MMFYRRHKEASCYSREYFDTSEISAFAFHYIQATIAVRFEDFAAALYFDNYRGRMRSEGGQSVVSHFGCNFKIKSVLLCSVLLSSPFMWF